MLAAIDVGSNTVRMLIGEVVDGQVKPHLYKRNITRLKGGQNSEGLASDAMERTLSAIREMVEIAAACNPDSIEIAGTEALRSACNGQQFAAMISSELGIELKIISGEREALYSSSGVLSVLDPPPEEAVIVDVGGGSTEMIVINDGDVIFSDSCPLGVVRLAEMESDKLRKQYLSEQIDGLLSRIQRSGALETALLPSTTLVGTAGTMTTLAAIDMEMTEYDWRRVNNYRLSSERINSVADILLPLSSPEKESIPGMEKGRGDLIIPGISILNALMKTLNKQQLIVSDFGLLEGLLLEMSGAGAIH